MKNEVPKILLLGSSGMLGSCFLSFFEGREDLKLSAFDHKSLDITNYSELGEVFREIRPDFVINCAAYTAVDDAESHREKAFGINAEAVREIALLCRESGAILIHFSTDYVFNGESANGYDEKAKPSPINIYGESKLAGEKALQEILEDFYIIRTSWLFGPNGKNFVDTMINLGQKGGELNVVNDQVGSPTFTYDLCKAVVKNFFESYFNNEKVLEFGIYHLTNSGCVSWHDFAEKIFEIKNIGVRVNSVGSEKFARPAKRPKCSILKNNKLPNLRTWEEALKDYLITPKVFRKN